MTVPNMASARETAHAAILILQSVLCDGKGIQCAIVLEHMGMTSEPNTRSGTAERIAMASTPCALHGRLERDNLVIRLLPPSEDMLLFLEMRKRKFAGDAAYFGAVPRRCLDPGCQIEITGSDTLIISAEAYLHLQTGYLITPSYSLSGDAPQRSGHSAAACWQCESTAGA